MHMHMAYAGLPGEPMGTPTIWRTSVLSVVKIAFSMSYLHMLYSCSKVRLACVVESRVHVLKLYCVVQHGGLARYG